MTQNMHNFIDNCKDKHLTLIDIIKMLPGEKLDVVIWNKNFEDCGILYLEDDGLPQRPEHFFKYNRHQITCLGNMKWLIHFNWKESTIHPIHLDVSCLDTDRTWCPIDEKDGEVHIIDKIIRVDSQILYESINVHWTKFPDGTRVGWNGPIMLWDELEDMPSVYFDQFAELGN
jgi:hypothetical protein